MESLRLQWLGTPLVELKGKTVKLETRKAAALLAYLSLAPGECPRETLATLFWGEKDQQKSLANLRRALSSLNSSLPGWVKADREALSFYKKHSIWLDTDAFRQALRSSGEHIHPHNELCEGCLTGLNQAVELYRGDFLEGINLSDCPGFDEWQFYQRDGLRQDLSRALQMLSAGYARREQWEQAIHFTRRWLALDRLHEPAWRCLIDLFARSGQKSAALHHYEELEQLLQEQLGQQPEPESRRLIEGLRGINGPKKSSQPDAMQSGSFPLLKTKLYIPAKPASRVIRRRLVERMDEIVKKPLTLISAPAGFGKTTLLAEWIAQSELAVAWLSLDQGDNEPYRFLEYLIAAIESIQEEAGMEARQLMRSTQMAPPHIVLAALLNRLGTLLEPLVLVLDDIQFITNHSIHEALAYLLDHLPANLHLVMATRADPPIQLGRLRATDQLVELRTQDLRFTEAEAGQFLNEVMQLGLCEDHVEALQSRTEGWVVGLQMAALSIKKCQDASEFIRSFSGSQRYVLDYLVEEVLRSQPAPIQTFLLETSILDKLSGPLCEALISREGSEAIESGQDILEYLERSNLFLIPLDDHKQWYRYHHLFADLLRARLEQSSAEKVRSLHARASRWFESQDFYNEAVEHALLSKDFERSAKLLDQSSQTRVLINTFMVQQWIQQIPEEIIQNHPWIQVSQAWLLLAMGKLEKVPELLQQAENAVVNAGHGPVSQLDVEDIRGNVAMLRAYVAFFRGDPRRTIELASVALQTVRPSNNFLRSRILLQLGESHSVMGDLRTGIDFLYDAIASSVKYADYSVATVAYFRLGNILKIMGRLSEAEQLYHQNLKALKEMGGYDSPMLGKPEVGLGDLLRERGQLDAARKLLESGHKHSERAAQPYDLAYSFMHRARLAEAEGNIEQAYQILAETEPLFLAYTHPPVVRMLMECQRLCLWLRLGRLELAERWVAEKQLFPGMEVTYPVELTLMGLARVLIAQGRSGEAQALLARLAQAAERASRNGRLIEILILQALAFQESGDVQAAYESLGRAWDMAEPEGYLRIFLDEGEPMIRLLALARQGSAPPLQRSGIDRLLATDRSRAR